MLTGICNGEKITGSLNAGGIEFNVEFVIGELALLQSVKILTIEL